MTTLETLNSEVENRQEEVKVGTELIFMVNGDSMTWEVTELFKGGFEAVDSDGEIEDFYFNELQTAWKFLKRH